MISKLIKELNMTVIIPTFNITSQNYDKHHKTFYVKFSHKILMEIIKNGEPLPIVILKNEKTGKEMKFTNPSWTAGYSATYTCGELTLKLHDNLPE